MRKYIFLILLLPTFTFAQYRITSSYLIEPNKAVGYVDSCASFWLSAYDQTKGGFYTNIDRSGNLISSWGTNKDMQTQSRDAYGFVRAFMLTGNENYLTMAHKALEFMYQHAWDKTNGGWFSNLDVNGNPTSSAKTAYDQHYALVGLTAYYEATHDTSILNWILRSYQSSNNLWDSRPDYFGYYDHSNADWTGKAGKSFNATVDAITTHLLSLYLITGNQIYKARMYQVVDNILNRFVPSMGSQSIGFVEEYDSDWNFDNTQTMTIMGHVLKAAWCLGRVYQLNPDTSYITAAKKLIQDVWQKGYDHQLGGPYKDFNRTNGQMLMWGIPDTAKAWWQMEQAIVSGLEWFNITKDSVCLQMADETVNFFMKYFVDHQYGEVYENRTRYGGQAWYDNKGDNSKAGYHSIETGYYIYLYGNLLLNHQPVTLYYDFTPSDSSRQLVLTPLSIPNNELIIKSVNLNSQPYNNFNASNRILILPAGISGKFAVTFEPAPITNVLATDKNAIPNSFKLYQNYPNPFNPTTRLNYSIKKESDVKIIIYNSIGQHIATLVDKEQAAGNYSINFNGIKLASGVYFYSLLAQPNDGSAGYRETRKMILLK